MTPEERLVAERILAALRAGASNCYEVASITKIPKGYAAELLEVLRAEGAIQKTGELKFGRVRGVPSYRLLHRL